MSSFTRNFRLSNLRLIRRYSSEDGSLKLPDFGVPLRVERLNETLDCKKARLIYQSRKRGILESDLLCSTFIQKHLNQLSQSQLEDYDRVLDENDWDLYYWCAGQKEIPERLQRNSVLPLMKEHFKNTGRQILRMPELSQEGN
ncbi:hypothetical protein MP638_001851 [Amoeboaphelidium occidentale]|nr:hypothetical protein MP638_001851 [Amoeboaphelidium occidentale]